MDIRIFTGGDLDIQTCFLILHSSDLIEDNFKKGDVTGTSFAATTRNVFEATQKPTNMLTFH